MSDRSFPHHDESTAEVRAPINEVFAYLDDPVNLSAHMGKSSMMMMGSKMSTEVDAGGGRVIGSKIRMRGSVMGIPVSLEEVITKPGIVAWRFARWRVRTLVHETDGRRRRQAFCFHNGRMRMNASRRHPDAARAPMTFPVGYHSLHPDPSMNFQMNRWFGWVGEPDMLEEMRRVAPRIATYGDWKRRSECAQNLYRFEPGGNHAAQTSRVKDPVEPSPRAKR